MSRLVLSALALLLWGCEPSMGQAADSSHSPKDSFNPRGTLRLELLGGGDNADIEDGSNLPEDSLVVFMARVEGADYLYLLQKSNGGVEVLHPSTGQVFMNRGGEQRIVPHRPNEADNQERGPAGYSGAGTGVFEYLLVASPVPRDFPSNSQIEEVGRLLAPPPYLEGAAAQPAVVVASHKVTWGVPED